MKVAAVMHLRPPQSLSVSFLAKGALFTGAPFLCGVKWTYIFTVALAWQEMAKTAALIRVGIGPEAALKSAIVLKSRSGNRPQRFKSFPGATLLFVYLGIAAPKRFRAPNNAGPPNSYQRI